MRFKYQITGINQEKGKRHWSNWNALSLNYSVRGASATEPPLIRENGNLWTQENLVLT